MSRYEMLVYVYDPTKENPNITSAIDYSQD